jgi:hypothetical protein
MKALSGVLLASVVALCAFSPQANANAVTIVSQNNTDFSAGYPLPPNVPQVALVGLSGTVYNDISGSTGGIDRSPFENAATPGSGYGSWASYLYDAVQGAGSGYVNLAGTNLYMLWGSPDTYNTISFCTGVGGGGTCTVGAYKSGVTPVTYGHDYIHFSTDFTFASVLFETGSNSLEFADVSTTPNSALLTPLPAALPLFAGGLGVMGLFARRRKRKSAAVTA